MRGNTKLIDYGIQTDASDYRAHVCVNAKTVYVFPTQLAAELVKGNHKYQTKPVFTNDIQTAKGYAVPVHDIPDIRSVIIPDSWLQKIAFSEGDSTSKKGEKAVKIVKGLLLRGMFPIFAEGFEVDETDLQIKGFDITVSLHFNIQVKCDYKGGGQKQNGFMTGNLFLQIAECNPFHQV